uniref:PDZ domain-containing protein n=1 Tax=Wuchereria bancrofti TaxID=6293 RepID=A0A1I8EQV3_WUCBA
MLGFLWGVFVGAVLMLLIIYVLLFNPFGEISSHSIIIDRFQPLRLPEELRQFLKEGNDESRVSEWESCFNLSLILHFLFQEHRDTRRLRRWIHRKLQLELSDLTTRNTAGRLIQDIRIRDLSIGCKSPVIKSIRVEDYELSQDENFKTLKLLADIDYSGGFQSCVDVSMLFGRFAQLSIKLTRLSGKIRLKLTREPFTHWVFAFIDMPTLEFQVDSQWQGKQVKHLIPFITQKFRRMVQRKHVWPNYKIRYRPLFPNPLYQPSPSTDSFEYIKTTGLLEVTVLRCTRLNTALVSNGNSEVFCVVSIDHRPLMEDASKSSTRCITVLLNFNRHGTSESIGLTFSKLISNTGVRSVQVSTVESSSSAERCGFKAGDVVLAVNNVPVTSERQLNKLLSGTSSELSVLVDRMICEKDSTSLSTLNNNEDTSLGDFDEIVVPEISENVKHRSGQMEVLEKGNHQRNRISTTINSNVTSNNFTADVLKNKRMLHLCAGGNFIDFLKMSEHSGLMKMAQSETENGCILRKHVRIRRTRSEAEITENGCFNSERLRPLFTSSFENLSYYTYKGTKRTLTNMAEDCVMLPEVSINRDSSIAVFNTDVSENRTKDFLRSSRRQRFQARAAEMAAAGKARMSDFWYRHKDVGSGAEVGVDALSQHDVDLVLSRTPLPTSGLECRKRNPLCKIKRLIPTQNDGHDLWKVPSKTLVTKSLAMSEDVLWDQSLHFDLSADTCKYLNVIVRARPLTVKAADVTISQDSQVTRDNSQMLGYISIYIPQVLDDCQLTLSNCYQELFTLRPPFCSASRRSLTRKAVEESRRAGFDERLCYGDIVLGFRYFPSGLPKDAENRSRYNYLCSLSKKSLAKNGFALYKLFVGPEELLSRRRRIAVKVSERLSSTWKSVGRRRASFHLLKENKGTIERKTSVIQMEADEVVPVRVSFKHTLEMKSAYLYDIYAKSDIRAIPDVFSMLELSENLSQMMYQPGNAYNEQMINAAKVAGKNMFADLDPISRKAKINEDMEKIRNVIHQTTIERLNVMKNMKNTRSGSVNFAVLEDRLQALAVLMLHYCAALQVFLLILYICGIVF